MIQRIGQNTLEGLQVRPVAHTNFIVRRRSAQKLSHTLRCDMARNSNISDDYRARSPIPPQDKLKRKLFQTEKWKTNESIRVNPVCEFGWKRWLRGGIEQNKNNNSNNNNNREKQQINGSYREQGKQY